MMFATLTTLAALALLSPFSSVAAGPVLIPRALAPADDPFYTPPTGFESTAPGTILKQRSIDAAFLGLLLDPVQAFQLLYRTTAVNGSAIATVTTIFKPFNAAEDRFVSFQTAYDSSATQCDPSYTYQLFAPQNDLITSTEFLILQGYLAAGYIVSAPDYEGPDAAFGAGRLAGRGTLDSMRAVSRYSNLSFSTQQPSIVGVGYSGGAIATGWAASLHHTYAPELPVKGWAQGGTPANLTGTLVYLDGETFSGFVPAAAHGLTTPSAYGTKFATLLKEIVTPRGQAVLDFAATHCAVADLLNFGFQSIFNTDFQRLGSGLLFNPIVANVLEEQTMGVNLDEVPIAPVYIYHATYDEIIPYANASTLVNAWCQQGASVNFVTYAAGGHITTEVLGFPEAITFAKSAFAGTVPSGCSSSTVFNNTLNPVALGVDLEPILVNLIQGLVHLGDGDQHVRNNLSTLKITL